MNFESIGLQGNHDALILINDMLYDDQKSWTGYYNRMWPHQREVAIMALCRMAAQGCITEAGGTKQAQRLVLAQLGEFSAAIEIQMKMRGTHL